MCDSSTINEENNSADNMILNRLLAIEGKVDKLLHFFTHNLKPEYLCNESNTPKIRIAKFNKISDQSELIEFESKLNDKSYEESLHEFIDSKFKNMEKFSKSHRRFAYEIIDTFCSRELYTNFSWSGKKGRDGKDNASLQDNLIFINFIFAIIKSKMPTFEFYELEDIFSILCRNKYTKK